MSNKGESLNKRIWSLFEDAGFATKPNSNDDTEKVIKLSSKNERPIDLWASDRDLGVSIIGENTTAKRLHSSFSSRVHDLEQLMKISQAKAGLFVFTNKPLSDRNRSYASNRGIKVWTEKELRYYESVVKTIGRYAKYEIIHSFGLTTNEEALTCNVLALKFNQPNSQSDAELFLFTITPENLLKTCVIYRKAQGDADTYQRMLKKKRLGSVGRFVNKDNALLPPNIIVHLSDTVNWHSIVTPAKDSNGNSINLTRPNDYELGILSIPMRYASMELIDGQHRLYGFVSAESDVRKNFNLVVLGIIGLSFETRRDMFVAINDNSRRMDANLVSYLKYTDEEIACQKDPELMAIKTVVALNNKGLFENKIRVLDVGKEKITLKGFSGYDLRTLLGPRGLLRKYYPANQSQEYIHALTMYFSILKSLFKTEWKQPENYIIFTNRGISAFLKLLKSVLKTCDGRLTDKSLKRYLKALKDNWSEDWCTKTLKNSYVGSKGWKDFHRHLVKAIQAKYPDFCE